MFAKISRYPLLILVLQIASTLFFGYQARAIVFDNRIERFAVNHHEGELNFNEFTQAFEYDEFFLVTLRFHEGRFNPARAESLLEILAEQEGIRDTITRGRFKGGDEEALALPFPFVEGNLYTGLFSLEPGADRGHWLASFLKRVALLESDNTELLQGINVAGEPIVNHYLNTSSREVKTRFFPLLIAVALILLGIFFRGLGPLLVTALSVGSALATTVGIMALAGQSMNLVTTLIPALVFVLGVAMQVHVLLAVGMTGSIEAGLREKIKPNFFVAVTTSIGFASLITSQVQPIVVMGRYMALGVWLIFLFTHLTHLSLSPLVRLKVTPPRLSLLNALFARPSYMALCARRPWLVLPLLVVLSGAWVLVHNTLESNGLNYFEEAHPIRLQTHFLESRLTGGSQLELLLRRTGEEPDEGDAFFPGEEPISAFEEGLLGVDHVRHLFSLYQFALVAEEAEDAVPSELLEPFISADYYRMSLLVDSLDREAYATLKQQIHKQKAAAGIEEPIIITGTLDRVIEIQDYLLSSLFTSLTLTILAVVVLLHLLLGRGHHFLVIFLPNLFPLGCMALAMWLFSIKTTLAGVMVFSIAFGIAVDDTIHLLYTFYKHKGEPFEQRWLFTLRQDARAIFLTSLVLTLGFLTLTSSSFIPTRDFGLLLGIGMMSAYLGDVIFVPMLLTREGKFSHPESTLATYDAK